MNDPADSPCSQPRADNNHVSRRRYERARDACKEAEALLEQKSRALFIANEKLSAYSADLERAVLERTADLHSALDRAEAASTARSRFIATMSHEIRTPLGGLLGMIDLLSMDETNPDKIELLNYAKSAGIGLNRIVNDVLDFSKMEAGVFVFEKENVDVRALLESIRILASSSEHGFNREFLVSIDESVPQLFLGDATRIRQVISNLVNNAVRYSTEGPISVKVGTLGTKENLVLRLEVEDFGVGIAPEDIENVFKDFAQISNPLTAAAQGTGLGLAICKRIINTIGGKISVDSTLGKGSTFYFEIPITVTSTESMSSHFFEELEDSNSISGRRVLLAEDNVINQKLLLTYIDRMGMKADLAENGLIALEKFAPGKYDLILMDVAMPKMDGLEAIRHIHDQWPSAQLPPILVLTAHVMEAIEDEVQIVGVNQILAKPIPYEELKLAIKTAIYQNESDRVQNREPSVSNPKKKNTCACEAIMIELIGLGNYDSLANMFGPEELMSFVFKFIDDSTDRIQKLLIANQTGDREEVSYQAHSLKGSCMVLGFGDLGDLAGKIEFHQSTEEDKSIAQLASSFQTRLAEIHQALSCFRTSARVSD